MQSGFRIDATRVPWAVTGEGAGVSKGSGGSAVHAARLAIDWRAAMRTARRLRGVSTGRPGEFGSPNRVLAGRVIVASVRYR